MRKGNYYTFQALFSLLITGLFWSLTVKFLDVAMNDFDQLENDVVTDAAVSPFLVFALGVAFYFILTVVYTLLGIKIVKDWKPTIIIGNVVIFILAFCVGIFIPGIMESVNEEIDKIPGMISNLLPF
jgi:hypothetical protein